MAMTGGPLRRAKRQRYLKAKRQATRWFYGACFVGVLVVGVALMAMGGLSVSGSNGPVEGRRLSGAGNCDFESEDASFLTKGLEGANGYGLLYLIITLYFFIGIAIVCDYFFEPSLGEISDALSLSPNVAGATFMAAGSSAPELFTSVGDTFATSNNIGIGTIVGSAMFNILIIVALSAMAAGQDLTIDWRPIARDVVFYTLSVISLLLFFAVNNPKEVDTTVGSATYGKVVTVDSVNGVEGLIMVLVYFAYILFMVFNDKIFAKCSKSGATAPVIPASKGADGFVEKEAKNVADEVTPTSNAALQQIEAGANRQTAPSEREDYTPEENRRGSTSGNALKAGLDMHITGDGGHHTGDGGEEEEGLFDWPDAPMDRFFYILAVPFKVAFILTIPDCNQDKWRFLYPLTFVMCIVWLGVCCMAMAMLGSAIGCIWGIDPFLMGIMVLAVGTSVPDAMASMIVAKAGEGDMAIANAIGSNVFDILLGLGLPWFAYGYSGFCQKAAHCSQFDLPHSDCGATENYGCYIDVFNVTSTCPNKAEADCVADCHWFPEIKGTSTDCIIRKNADSNLTIDVAILFGTIVFFVATLMMAGWKMGRSVAMRLLGLYVLYIVFQLVFKAVNDAKE